MYRVSRGRLKIPQCPELEVDLEVDNRVPGTEMRSRRELAAGGNRKLLTLTSQRAIGYPEGSSKDLARRNGRASGRDFCNVVTTIFMLKICARSFSTRTARESVSASRHSVGGLRGAVGNGCR